MKPRGFGAPFWARRISAACPYTVDASDFQHVVEELVAQTRLDEALMCERAIAPALGLDARILSHRRDLRAARRRSK